MARHHVVFGLGFGDEGKGSIVDHLVRQTAAKLVVRFNGGAQAAHNVVTPDGRHHTFSQYGAGAFAGAETFLSRHMMVNPLTMAREGDELAEKLRANPIAYADGRALVTTPYHMGLNRLREAVLRHGSCGMGVGETRLWASEGVALRVQDIVDVGLADRLRVMREQLFDVGLTLVKHAALNLDTPAMVDAMSHLTRDPDDLAERLYDWATTVGICEPGWLRERLGRHNYPCVFEGAQGVLLDEHHGWAPHYTWSTCTPDNAHELLAEAGVARADYDVIGVLRAYHTRHGAGPFPSEALRSQLFPEAHNGDHAWQGRFRWGLFDERLARYALEVSGQVDGLAVTHLDRQPDNDRWLFCTEYVGQPGTGKPDIAKAEPSITTFDARGTGGLLACVRAALTDKAPPIKIASYGPTANDKRVPE